MYYPTFLKPNFNCCRYIAAAELLAQSSDPFEVSVLNFLSTVDDRRDGLKRFLDLQLNKMTASEVGVFLELLNIRMRSKSICSDCERRKREKMKQRVCVRKMRFF